MKRLYYNELWAALATGAIVELGKLYVEWPRPWEPIAGVLIVGVAVWAVRNFMRPA